MTAIKKITENLKPFNLEAALRGEPVMLRDGSKAFVRHYETEAMVGDHWRIWGTTTENPSLVTWAKNGDYYTDGDISDLDIIGMWAEPRITRTINGFEVPAPEGKAPKRGVVFFAANPHFKEFHAVIIWRGNDCDLRTLERGLVFLSKEDSIANAKAMLGIDPYEESEEKK